MTERRRTLASAITYRVTSTILLMVLSYAIAGQLIESIAISVSFAFFATILFYFNDRAWERTDWGRTGKTGSSATRLEARATSAGNKLPNDSDSANR